ncbi:MAG: hypothetical protein E7422_10365 [Ruminococcaceae bacterium]|nr:hypothetical protein [Oscillospiraceae bacterium]
MTMTGGTISGNTAGDGGGVYVGCCSAFTVSGAPVIKDNQKTNSQNADNVAFYGNSIDDGKITVGALTDGACIYVNSMDNVDKDGSNCITVGNALLASSLTGGTVTAPANSLLVCATYKDGRMTGVQTVTLAENCIGKAASELLTVPTNGQYKLFLLDGKTYAPLCAAWDSARE